MYQHPWHGGNVVHMSHYFGKKQIDSTYFPGQHKRVIYLLLDNLDTRYYVDRGHLRPYCLLCFLPHPGCNA